VRTIEVPRAELQHLDEARLVERRIGVGRARKTRYAPRDRGFHLRFERRHVLEAGLAQPRREIDKPRTHDQTVGVDRAARRVASRRVTDRCNPARRDVHVSDAVDPVFGIDDATAFDMNLHAENSVLNVECLVFSGRGHIVGLDFHSTLNTEH
jgi:hypothetical protein